MSRLRQSIRKVLVIRFSSMGDVVLTSPVVRSLKQACPEIEIHFLTKAPYVPLVAHSPYIEKVHILPQDFAQLRAELKAESFDYVIDLHHNLRSFRVKQALRKPYTSFDKQNLRKWWMVRAKKLEPPVAHIVERYGRCLKPLGLELDGGGLDLFLPDELDGFGENCLAEHALQQPLAVVLGATHKTKRWLPTYFIECLNRLGRDVILLGGKDLLADAAHVSDNLTIQHLNGVGAYSMLESAAILKACSQVLTHDTGLMHIAAAFRIPAVVLWGNTLPEIGMYPWQSPHENLEAKDVSCRPCSKIGHDACPQGHFRCMKELKPDVVVKALRHQTP
ncbi:MAG: glycosyltransferase family 9 protein [Bacteroidota bacterium]